ncbi:TetR/AcrR family transcriptional regulator [Levilactobacillus spicheri]|uniref:HTH-type transcriptional regulator n=1 Tax=Levilactobacillus spicheri TaxID=216463 RepID=A0ABQ0WQR7_9LACO|nr:TetR/AcrR family transcriptional regulator [Levilactobacillus spicheri]GEO66965.1 HTH-type transcriptional regulator [Levilactobacillus spicheri]
MRQDAQQNRQKILTTANQLFREHTAADVTMAQLARAAQVGVGTLYRNFPTKGDLFLALAYDQLGSYVRQQRAYLAIHPVDRAALKHALKGYLAFRENRYQVLPKGSLEPASQYYQRSDYQDLVDLFAELIHGVDPHLAPAVVTFKTDLLIAFLRSDSYALQRDVRHYSETEILNQLMTLLFPVAE